MNITKKEIEYIKSGNQKYLIREKEILKNIFSDYQRKRLIGYKDSWLNLEKNLGTFSAKFKCIETKENIKIIFDGFVCEEKIITLFIDSWENFGKNKE